MLECYVEVQVAQQTESSPAVVSSLRQGSVLDVLCSQPNSVTTLDKPAEAHRMFKVYEFVSVDILYKINLSK